MWTCRCRRRPPSCAACWPGAGTTCSASTDTAPTTPDQDALLARFLEAYFPTPAPFER
ncbi:hypothetical protein [Microbispora sp. GKU 823]|uniref:hypothetical protein n=1 Tax=Microbispora sp. GKU 823 TaxID=1652100 RepID=UPI003563F8F0